MPIEFHINYDNENAGNQKQKGEMVPPVMVRTGLNYRRNALAGSLQFSHTAAHFTDATNARRTSTAVEGLISAYQVVDFSTSYNWKFLTNFLLL